MILFKDNIMLSKIINYFFNSNSNFQSKKIKKIIDSINCLETQFSNFSDIQLKKKLKYLKN